MEWQPIETAPKDGTVVRVGWAFEGEDKIQEWFTMQWGDIQRNGMFPGVTGMWVSPDGSFTWSEADKEGAPTHWMPVPSKTLVEA